jgi:hypothetical protein
VATTCNADGSDFEAGGTNCADTSRACEAGVCKDVICTPSSTFCAASGNVMQCNALGTAYSMYDYCMTTEFCETQSSTSAVCTTDVCTAGATTCVLEAHGTCTANGSEYTNFTDCTASGLICGASGCASSVTDSVGTYSASDQLLQSMLIGNVVRVDVDRTLTSITQHVNLVDQVQFMVYESATLNGPYSPLVDVPGSNVKNGVYTSGPISVSLQAGSYYVIGLWTPDWPIMYYSNDDPPIGLSFGAVLGEHFVVANGGPPSSLGGPTSPSGTGRIQLQDLVTAPPL